MSFVPVGLGYEYKHFGYITPWDSEVAASGADALLIINSLYLISACIWVFVAFNTIKCIGKIRQGDYFEEDPPRKSKWVFFTESNTCSVCGNVFYVPGTICPFCRDKMK
jgi:hypothetical protein